MYIRWEDTGFQALEIVAYFYIGDTRYEIVSPSGNPMSQQMQNILKVLKENNTNNTSKAHCEFFVRTRKEPFTCIGKLLELECPIIDCLSWMGWGRTFDFDVQVSINDRLEYMNNDYWLIELLAKKLGVKDFIKGECPKIDLSHVGLAIIIPGFGIHETIDIVIESIMRAISFSKLKDWECIIVDDANVVPLIINQKNENIRVVRSDSKIYSGGARNKGIELSKYNNIMFLDGDTILQENFIYEHLFRQLLAPNVLAVSFREYLPEGKGIQSRQANIEEDTRIRTSYSPGRLGLFPVNKEMEVCAFDETDAFKHFGYGMRIGPVDLAFMVKGNNMFMQDKYARIKFPPSFVGYGPEDGTFAAKAIARGAMVVPVLSTGVFHVNHAFRSGSEEERTKELRFNLIQQEQCLNTSVWNEWEE
mgnify:FL=1